MSRVYLALQKSLQRYVAVKFLDRPDKPGFHQRFMNEGRYLAALSHSNIVEVYDVGEQDGKYFIVMEYLPQGDLKKRIIKGIKPVVAIKIIRRIAICLDFLHEKGIIHRDLKPANILFRADGNPVITDFGIAKLLQDNGDKTLNEGILGSPSYLSPEQAGFSGEIDGRSDLYSLGVILFEMLTGEKPFKGKTFAEIVMAHHENPIPRLPDQLSQFQPLLNRLLAKNPDYRYQNGQELVQAIRDLRKAALRSDNPTSTEAPLSPALEITATWNRPPPDSVRVESRAYMSRLVSLMLIGLSLYPIAPVTKPVDQNLLSLTLLESLGVSPVVLQPVKAGAMSTLSLQVVQKQWVSSSPDKAIQEKVDELMAQAYERMDRLRLSLPKGDSALDYFRQILELDPKNRAAKAGLRQIVRWYVDQTERALNDNQIDLAKRYLDRGLSIDERHPKLIALLRKVESPPNDG